VNGAQLKKPPVHRITVTQILLLVILCLMLLKVDQVWAYSMFFGGLIAVLPQAYFAVKVFHQTGARSAETALKASYTGEVGKFVLTAVGFAAVFAMVSPLSGLTVFIGYLIMLVIQITGSWMLLR